MGQHLYTDDYGTQPRSTDQETTNDSELATNILCIYIRVGKQSLWIIEFEGAAPFSGQVQLNPRPALMSYSRLCFLFQAFGSYVTASGACPFVFCVRRAFSRLRGHRQRKYATESGDPGAARHPTSNGTLLTQRSSGLKPETNKSAQLGEFAPNLTKWFCCGNFSN